MADPVDPTENILRYDELNNRVQDLEEKLATARQMLDSGTGNGKTLQDINATLQEILKSQSSNTAQGKNNLTFSSMVFGTALGHKVAEILPSGGVKTGMLGVIGGSMEFGKIMKEMLNGAVSLTKVGELGMSAFTAWSGAAHLNQSLLQSGAITGQGEGAGVRQLTTAIGEGFQSLVNPFAMTSIQFADEIITTFRSTGFKDSLAYSLSHSVVSMNNQIGEKMTKQLLPVITDVATATANQTTNIANYNQNVVNAVSDLTENVKVLQKSSAATNTSAVNNLATYSSLLETVRQQGFVTSLTATQLRNFTYQLSAKTGYGLTGDVGNAAQSLNALVQHGILGAYSGLTPQTAYSTPANLQKTLLAFGQFFENMFVKPMEMEHPDTYWKSHQDELQTYINQRIMPMLQMVGVTMSPDQVKKMITDSMSGGKSVAKATASLYKPGGPLSTETSSIMGSVGNVMSGFFRMGIPLNKENAQFFLDKGMNKKTFTHIMSRFKDTQGLSYNEFQQAFLANPDMNVGQWIQSKVLEAQVKNTILPTLSAEGVSKIKLDKVDRYIEKGLQEIERQAAQGNLTKDQFNKDIGDIIQVIVTSTGSTSAFEKALNKKIQVLGKRNGKTITNQTKYPT